MGDVKGRYGAKTAIAATLTSLANLAAWQTAVVDFTASLFLDAIVRVQSKAIAGATAQLDVYVYAALGDTTYTDGASGSDATFTTANRLNAKYLGSITLNTTNGIQSVLGSVADAFNGVMPDKWGLIFVNNSGAALSATAGDHVVEFEGVFANVA